MTDYFKIFILSFFALNIYGQNNKYVKEFITTSQGLSHNRVTSIVSDDLNIKWIGTRNGITKYNGYDFEYIKPGQKHKDLLNENIEVLFKDKESNIWIGTKSGGLSYIDTQNNITKNVNHLISVANEGSPRITALSQDTKGNIWVGTYRDGVYVIDFLNNTLVNHFTFLNPVYSILKDFNGYMWFSMGKQLVKYIAEDDRLDTQNIPGVISSLMSDPSRNKIWISTINREPYIYNYDYSTGLIEAVKTNIRSNFTKQLSIDKNHRIWIGTWSTGVYRSNSELTEFNQINLVHRNSEKISANYNNILKILHDKNNITWLATGNGGIVKLIEGNGFNNASELIKNNDLIENLNITAGYKDSNKLFIGTAYNGLFYGDSFSNLKQLNETKNTRINALYQHNGRLYIGCSNGFYIFSIEEEKVVFSKMKLNKNRSKVTAFHIDAANNLYIGTQERGFSMVNLESIDDDKAYKRFSNNTGKRRGNGNWRITGIKEDKNGHIWMSTNNGLYLFDIEKKELINQRFLLKEKLPSVIINSLHIQDEYIWLATPGGLIKLSFNNGKLKIEDKITKKNGLNSDFVCGVIFDENSNLWISTHTEIVKYTPSNKSIISYSRINGINTTSFNNGCVFNYNETFYFGGIDNITFFEPQKITNTNTVPEIIFTNLRVNNNLVQYDTENKILDKNVNYAKKIKLSHKDQFFSVGFVANDYLGNLNIKYRYLLDGYQNDWIDLQSRNEINFAGLPSGNYKLKIEGTRDDQTWSKSKSIDIVLLGSPWKSPLAVVFYTLLIILIAAYFLKLYKDKLKLRNNLQLARMDKKREIEVAESKLAFFTNISHEFRTPLTLIISPLQEILENKNLTPKITNKLRYIDKNTNKLLDLINQLLDFRKADHGHLKLNLSQGDFIEFSKEVQLYFKETAKSKSVKLEFESKLDNIKFSFDRNKMEIVLSNLLSNAIKHTSEGDKIVMSIDTEGEFCLISIKDTGIGMNAQNIERIFERFFQIKSADTAKMTGSGIGLYFSKKIIELHKGSIDVKSKENIGTEFVIKLFMDQKLIDSEINEIEISTDSKEQNHTVDVETPAENLLDSKAQTVLIIDDNLDILNYLEEVLSDTYKIIKANNGDLGFKMATSKNPDLIVSDVMMPIKDGITLCKELKSQFITSHIPIILLTARSSTLFEIEGLKTGADDYVTKPFNASIVKARIASLLENRAQLRAHFLKKVRFEPASKVASGSNSDRDNSFINKAMLLVEKNLDNPSFGIEIMVDELNMSQSTLYRKIKSLTGLSLTAFIRSIRLKKAAALILTEDLNLNQIAYEVGFNDYKYFTDTFKVQFKCLPSKYKESLESV